MSKRWVLVVMVACGCSKGDTPSANESPKPGSAVKAPPADDPKVKETLTADLKAWVDKTYTSEPHKVVDIAGRETTITCKLEPSIGHPVGDDPVADASIWLGVVDGSWTLSDHPSTVMAVFQKGEGGWTCLKGNAPEQDKMSANLCENLATYCARNPPPPKVASLWEYSEREDKMRGTKTKRAVVRSLNEVPTSFPRPGKTKLEIIVRQDGTKQDSLLRATNTSLDACVPQCTVSVRFGDGPVTDFTAYPSTGIPGEAVFIANTARWVKQLKGVKLAIVEVSLFEGKRQFEFAVGGLEWPR